MGFRFSRDGRRIAADTRDEVVALFDASGALLRRFDLGGVEIENFALSADGRRLALATPDRVHVVDAGSGEEISRLEAGRSYRIDISGDGGRVLTSNRRETVLWDVERRQAIWTEPRARPVGGPLALTADGRHVVWGGEGVLHFHAVDGRDQELALAENLLDATFSYDSRRLAVVSSRSISVWEVDGLRPVFRVANPTSVYQEIYWSGDGSALFNVREFVDTVLLDSHTGRALATFDPSKPAGNAAHDLLSPDLRYRVARGDGSWDIRPLPAPDRQSPRDSLARVLEEAGLEMQGVELVFATGAP